MSVQPIRALRAHTDGNGSVIAAALLETLFDKEILTLIEAQTVLDSAMHSLAPVAQSPEGFAAAQIIGALQKGKFSARG